MTVEQENLVRTLKEEPLIVSSFWCRFGFHRWTKWSEEEKYGSFEIWQQHNCVHCNRWGKKVFKIF